MSRFLVNNFCTYYSNFERNPSKAATTLTAMKTSLENVHLGNGDDFVIIASSSHPLLLTEHAANGLVAVPLK